MTGKITLRLWCLIDGESALLIMNIEVDIDSLVYDLKPLVAEQATRSLQNVNIMDLTLWKVHDVELTPTNTIDERIRARGTDFSKFCDKLDPLHTISQIFGKQPPQTQLHILVQPPSGWEVERPTSTKRKRESPTDITAEIFQCWKTPNVTLPKLEGLVEYLEAPLEEAAKVPLSNSLMRSMVTHEDYTISCTIEIVEQLFRESEDETAQTPWRILDHAIMFPPPADNCTEPTFISFWDSNIRNILEATVYPSESVRHSSKGSSTAFQGPDYGLLAQNACVFRGEEKAPNLCVGRHPRDDLVDDLIWTYDPAPYILGYHAVGAKVTLAAILPSLKVVDLMTADLSYRSERFANIKHIIKLCRVIQALRDVIGERNSPEFVPFVQGSTGTVTFIGASSVVKKYTSNDRVERVMHLRDIYEVLRDKAVPSVDSLFYSYLDDPTHGSVVYLKPKGMDGSPRRAREVREAVVCVLEALVVLHADPNPLFHRDIRWRNIIRDASDRTKWFLIDWDEAATPPTRAAKHLNKDSHSPSVFKDGHGAEVDIWGVGTLIIDAAAFSRDIPAKLMAVGERMQSGLTTTAAQGLQDMKNLGTV